MSMIDVVDKYKVEFDKYCANYVLKIKEESNSDEEFIYKIDEVIKEFRNVLSKSQTGDEICSFVELFGDYIVCELERWKKVVIK